MKKLKKVLIVLGSIIGVWFIIGCIPPLKSAKSNEWLEYRESLNRPLISAHRGGSLINPENTEMAFDYIVENDLADIIEIDIRVTKDNKLAIIHDDTVDRVAMSDYQDKKSKDPEYKGTIVVNQISYDELLQYNLGLNFETRDKKTPYKDITLEQADELGLTVMLLEEFLTKYESSDIKVLIEIKDKGELAIEAANKISGLLNGEFKSWKKDAMIISFADNAISHVNENDPEQLLGALGYGKIIPEIITHFLRVPVFYKANYDCIQTPMNFKIVGPLKLKFATKGFIKQAHKRNQTVAFYTINNPEDMDTCIKVGADIITTDAPDVLSQKLGRM